MDYENQTQQHDSERAEAAELLADASLTDLLEEDY